MHKFSWLKDSLIQIVFISFAVVLTVFIAQISLSEQYTEYYENKLEEKTQSLARNAALLFVDSEEIYTADSMESTLNMSFPRGENTSFTLFDTTEIIASGTEEVIELPQEALLGEYTYIQTPFVRSFYPFEIDGTEYVLMIQIDDTSFLEYSEEMSSNMYTSLFRGCLLMGGGYLVFSVISNLLKKKKEEKEPEPPASPEKKEEALSRLFIQIFSLFFCGVVSVPFWIVNAMQDEPQSAAFVFAVFFTAVAVLHFLRIILWLLAWFSKRPISSYAAQTMQFFVFLAVFLAIYVISIQDGYTEQIQSLTQNELRNASLFAAFSLNGETQAATLLQRTENMDIDKNSEIFILTRDGDTFSAFGRGTDVSEANDIFLEAWEQKASLMGIRGDYKYGVTIIVDDEFQQTALAVIRQSTAVLANEMREKTIDFLLTMSATVFAFVFLFVEVNRILEVINTPNPEREREREYRYARSIGSLMFLINLIRFFPMFFLVLLVAEIYQNNPIAWLPENLAVMLPIMVTVLLVAAGSNFLELIVKTNPRKLKLAGCIITAIGFLSIQFATTLPTLLLILAFAYMGVSMLHNKLWDLAAEAENTGFPELGDTMKHALAGEYLGATAGAVIGAVLYDKLGLSAAFIMSSIVLLILFILIWALLPAGEKPEKAEKQEKGEYGFFKFVFSKRIFLYFILLLMPYVFGEFFVGQYSPLYADSINLSPGAVSWTSLLMTMAIAHVAPTVLRIFTDRISIPTICVISTVFFSGGLLLFGAMPGIFSLYAASALVGLSVGVGKNIIGDEFASFSESNKYKNSGILYNILYNSVFSEVGIIMFTIMFNLSPSGGNLLVVGAIITVGAILYLIFSKLRGAEYE